jgi:hypothetical protein
MYVLVIIIVFIYVYVRYLKSKRKQSKRFFTSPIFTINPPTFSVDIIVARYSENVEWTKLLPNATIYNKGKDLSLPNHRLLNVGREGHTYYHHIVTHYDHLPDAILFLQGNPFDHSPNLFRTIKNLFSRDKPPSFYYLSEKQKVDSLDGSWWHFNVHSYINKLPQIPKDLPKKVYYTLFNTYPSPHIQFKYGCGAQFMVSKESILKHPKSFYQKICTLLGSSSNPVEGFVIERFHHLLFR